MKFNSLERVLVSGLHIELSDITDLLYFDKLTCADERLIVMVNDRIESSEKLIEKGLIVHRNSILPEIEINEFESSYPSFGKQGEVARSFLHADRTTVEFAKFARQKGVWAVPKTFHQFWDNYNSNSKNEVLSIIYSQFPQIQVEKSNLDSFISFITDEETIEKRRRMFKWQNKIESELKKGSIDVEEIYEIMESAIDDYITWYNEHIKKIKYKIIGTTFFEIVSNIFINLLRNTQKIGIPITIAKIVITLSKNSYSLKSDELEAPGSELAYLVHLESEATKRFRSI